MFTLSIVVIAIGATGLVALFIANYQKAKRDNKSLQRQVKKEHTIAKEAVKEKRKNDTVKKDLQEKERQIDDTNNSDIVDIANGMFDD